MDGLKTKQRVFLEAYLETWNASEAARRAGYKGDANTVGPRMLANVGIQQAIRERLKEKAMSADEVIVRLTAIAQVSVSKFVEKRMRPVLDDEGNLLYEQETFGLNWDEIENRGHLIKSITSTSHGPRIELHDSMTALIQLGKAYGLFTDRVEQRNTQVAVNLYLPKKDDSSNDPNAGE